MGPGSIHTAMLQPRGAAYRRDRIVPHSHYLAPIDRRPGRLAGRSRRWGDADPEVQSRVIDLLLEAAVTAGLTPRDMALVLAIARRESGFNPDAAAGTTSAFGIGQFIDRTGARYGLDAARRGDAREQARALVAHYLDNRRLAAARGQGEDHIYKYHHDGPVLDYGGLAISRSDVLPHAARFEPFVQDWLHAYHAGARGPLADGRLEEGDSGPDVRALQARLNAHGARDASGRTLPLTGRFLRRTREAVEGFQRRVGLAATGIADAATRAALAGPPAGDAGPTAAGREGSAPPGTARQMPAPDRSAPGRDAADAAPDRASNLRAAWEAPAGQDGAGGWIPPGHALGVADAAHAFEPPLLTDAVRHVASLDRLQGRRTDAISDGFARALADAARARGLERIDEVRVSADGWQAFALQHTPQGSASAPVDVFRVIAGVRAEAGPEPSRPGGPAPY